MPAPMQRNNFTVFCSSTLLFQIFKSVLLRVVLAIWTENLSLKINNAYSMQ
uniref:Uncharacterized protein n=1 Tax=Physcomitrium patens TaxID=3218 RepID=A0A2K1K6B4_PHYPA|nr:hypothetical protein PHYPA_011215 [Physcomitrium patens]